MIKFFIYFYVIIIILGTNGLWGKSLVLYNPDTDFRICSTITTRSSSSIEYIAEAKFRAGVAGSIYFRWLKDAEQSDLLIYSNLFHTRDENRNSQVYSQHDWKIYVTDIFESMAERIEENCNVLQVVYDPQNYGAGKGIGDIDSRVGKLNISENVRRENIRQLFRYEQLVLLPADLTGPSRKLYVVIYDAVHPTNFLACAKIRHLAPRVVK